MNSVHPAIQFTYDTERDILLPFLNVCAIRSDGPDYMIDTDVYRKPCDSGNFLDFRSHHPLQHKGSVVRSFLHRSNTIPSNATYGANGLILVHESFKTNVTIPNVLSMM